MIFVLVIYFIIIEDWGLVMYISALHIKPFHHRHQPTTITTTTTTTTSTTMPRASWWWATPRTPKQKKKWGKKSQKILFPLCQLISASPTGPTQIHMLIPSNSVSHCESKGLNSIWIWMKHKTKNKNNDYNVHLSWGRRTPPKIMKNL